MSSEGGWTAKHQARWDSGFREKPKAMFCLRSKRLRFKLLTLAA